MMMINYYRKVSDYDDVSGRGHAQELFTDGTIYNGRNEVSFILLT
jgi:hypothetical protein